MHLCDACVSTQHHLRPSVWDVTWLKRKTTWINTKLYAIAGERCVATVIKRSNRRWLANWWMAAYYGAKNSSARPLLLCMVTNDHRLLKSHSLLWSDCRRCVLLYVVAGSTGLHAQNFHTANLDVDKWQQQQQQQRRQEQAKTLTVDGWAIKKVAIHLILVGLTFHFAIVNVAMLGGVGGANRFGSSWTCRQCHQHSPVITSLKCTYMFIYVCLWS